MNTNPTQEVRVLEYMEKHGGITQLQALNELGVLRLASRISSLRKKGLPIESKFVSVRNRYGEECRVKQYSIGGGDNR
jgi:hypothetical protein